jgi:multicomponent Na+:H+ antiporter subunit D
LVSSLLNVAYLLPVAARGFFVAGSSAPHPNLPPPGGREREETGDDPNAPTAIREAPLACVVPLCLTALGCVLLFFLADALYVLLAPIAAR